MKKDKLYLFTFTSLLFIVYLVGYYSMNYLIDVNTEQLLEIQMESSKREAKEFSYMISSQLNNDIPEVLSCLHHSFVKTIFIDTHNKS